jgi:PAS domain-containing protein
VEVDAAQEQLRSMALAAKLQRLTASLAKAEQASVVAEIAYQEGGETLGATGGSVVLTDVDLGYHMFEWDEDVGIGEAVRLLGRDYHGPAREASLRQQPVFVESAAERDERFPMMREFQPDALAVAVVPLVVAGELVGLLRFSFSAPHLFDGTERAYLAALAGQTAQACARVRAWAELRRAGSPDSIRVVADAGIDRFTPVDLALLRTLYDDAPVAVAIFDRGSRSLRLNPVFAAMRAGTVADKLGRTAEQMLGPTDGVLLRTRVESVMATGQPVVHEELSLFDALGRTRQWCASWLPLRGTTGRIDAVVAILAEAARVDP